MTTAGIRTTDVDRVALETKVKAMYRAVAEAPHDQYHFEMGRALAERLGYPPELLDRVPGGALESFAGVGYFFDLAEVAPGEHVLDLGSGSGTDSFAAALQVGAEGRVSGVDLTPEQLTKAEQLRAADHLAQVDFTEGHIEALAFDDEAFDLVISNGVINLAPDKDAVFAEASRVLRPGGRMAIADIVTDHQLSRGIVCNADLWASCIGGAAQVDAYQRAVEEAGLVVVAMKRNPYEFLSQSAQAATSKYGVRSISLLARKPG
jgi:ubiquinone/menaquinone biosynthesis C-methylase UbiE